MASGAGVQAPNGRSPSTPNIKLRALVQREKDAMHSHARLI